MRVCPQVCVFEYIGVCVLGILVCVCVYIDVCVCEYTGVCVCVNIIYHLVFFYIILLLFATRCVSMPFLNRLPFQCHF